MYLQIIYLDEYFLLNGIADYLLLLTTAKICAVAATKRRLFCGAAVVALYAVLALLEKPGFIGSFPMPLLAAAAMLLAAFGGEKRLLRISLVFFAVSALFGGAVTAASYLSGRTQGRMADFRLLIPVFALCYALVTLLFRHTGRNAVRSETAAVQISAFGNEIRLLGLWDTGNALYDPVTGRPVTIVGLQELRPLFPPLIRSLLGGTALEDPASVLCALSGTEYMPLFRLLPYSTIGEKGMLLAFRSDKIVINGKEQQGGLIAIAPRPLSDGNTYSALLGT